MKRIAYHEKLPRKVKGINQCNALDENGNRCKKKAIIETIVHGDPEIYRTWVRVYLCKIHAWDVDLRDVKEEK